MENVTNKVLLSGHLGQEPIIKQFESKTASGKNNKMALLTPLSYILSSGALPIYPLSST